jgi:hypothetical protein
VGLITFGEGRRESVKERGNDVDFDVGLNIDGDGMDAAASTNSESMKNNSPIVSSSSSSSINLSAGIKAVVNFNGFKLVSSLWFGFGNNDDFNSSLGDLEDVNSDREQGFSMGSIAITSSGNCDNSFSSSKPKYQKVRQQDQDQNRDNELIVDT